MIDLDKLEALEKLSVPAPWEADEVCRTVIAPFEYEGTGMVGSIVELDDMRFIAAMRNALPDLIAEIRRLRQVERWAGAYVDALLDQGENSKSTHEAWDMLNRSLCTQTE